MAEKLKDKDVLVVRDEQTGEIGVVAGLKQDGSPNLASASAKQSKDFLKFDKHSDALESFFMNFFRQYKEPSRFGFYRVAAEGIEHVIEVMKDLLKDPESNKELLAPHRIDMAGYAPSAKITDQNQGVTTVSEEGQQKEKKVYQPIDEKGIDWKVMEDRYGIRREDLERTGDLTKMLNYGKSDLMNVKVSFGDQVYEVDARLSLKADAEGKVGIVPHLFRKEPNLKNEFAGHTFTREDIDHLKRTGNMGRVVELIDPQTQKKVPSYISIDRQTNEVVSVPVRKVRFSNTIGQTQLSKAEMAKLRAGEALYDRQVILTNGKKFKATLQVNVEQRGVEFVPRTADMRRSHRPLGKSGDTEGSYFQWLDEKGVLRASQKMGGVELTPEQRARFQEGKAILVKDMQRDGKGEPYTAYVRYDYAAGKPRYYQKDPDQVPVKQAIPASESQTQVAVNTEGKTNEATKHIAEPLSKAQAYPKTEQQQNRQEEGTKPSTLKKRGVTG